MIKIRLLMAGIAIAAISTTGCSPKVVAGDTTDSNQQTMRTTNNPEGGNASSTDNSNQLIAPPKNAKSTPLRSE